MLLQTAGENPKISLQRINYTEASMLHHRNVHETDIGEQLHESGSVAAAEKS